MKTLPIDAGGSAHTRWDIRGEAHEQGWDLDLVSEDSTFTKEPRFFDVFCDSLSGDRIVCEYAPRSRQLMVVELIMNTDPVRCVYWRDGTRDKKHLVYCLLAADTIGRENLAAHWTYGRDNWRDWCQRLVAS